MKLAPLLLSLALVIPGHAQDKPSGYKSLSNAADSIVLQAIEQQQDQIIQTPEAIERRRAVVTDNASALKQLRAALKSLVLPPDRAPTDQTSADMAYKCAPFGELLRQESDVRAADGDWSGAFDSRITAIELGVVLVQVSGGSTYFPQQLEAIGRARIDALIKMADAPTLRAALVRLKASDANRRSFAEVGELEKKVQLEEMAASFKNEAERAQLTATLASPEVRQQMGITEEQTKELETLSLESFQEQTAAFFDALISRDRLPYARARKIRLNLGKGVLTQLFTRSLNDLSNRFQCELNLTNQFQFEHALELKAIKLESGAYPEKFQTALDPFGDGTRFIYHRVGKGYSLYSIGPDGRDGGGEEIQTIEIDRQTGTKTVSQRPTPDSVGDIVGPIF